jgi:hypothetical protein
MAPGTLLRNTLTSPGDEPMHGSFTGNPDGGGYGLVLGYEGVPGGTRFQIDPPIPDPCPFRFSFTMRPAPSIEYGS